MMRAAQTRRAAERSSVSRRFTRALCALLLLAASACAEGEIGQPQDPDDMISSPQPDLPLEQPDLPPTRGPDMADETPPDGPPPSDMTPDMPAVRLRATQALTGGGGRLQSPRYRARVLIGAPAPAGAASGGARLGPGPAQHGQLPH